MIIIYHFNHMCEILVLKKNTKKLFFSKEAIREALYANRDGLGYAIFKKNKGHYDLVETKHYDINTQKKKKQESVYIPYDIQEISLYEKEYRESNGKEREKIINEIYKKQFELKEKEIIIIHFRLATSGNSFTNTQPIVEKNFLMIHNGVFHALGNKHASDTKEFINKLQTLYDIAHIKTKKEEKTFIKTFLELNDGYYSTFIYSMKTRQLYYFKKDASFYSFANNTMYSTKEMRFPIKTMPASMFV